MILGMVAADVTGITVLCPFRIVVASSLRNVLSKKLENFSTDAASEIQIVRAK